MTNTRLEDLAVNPDDDALAAERVVTHIERLIVGGQLKPGDRLPAERELALHIKVSRPSVRAGLRSLAAVGVVESRHGAGSFITSGPPRLSTGPLSLLAALHGFTRDDMFDARRVLEMGAARLAAERAKGEDMATMSEEVAGMFASLEDPQAFLVHDVRFHRAVAMASHNPVLAALVEMVSTMVYERRRLTVERARDLKESAEMHRRIYAAIREHDPDRAREEMSRHLDLARMAQASEDVPDDGLAPVTALPPAPAPPPPRARR
jgi:GntR family transcriptional repressor for pyruvate dehydrogenase complex